MVVNLVILLLLVLPAYLVSYFLHFQYRLLFPQGSDRDWVVKAKTPLEKFISLTGGAMAIIAVFFAVFWLGVLLVFMAISSAY